MVILAFFVGHWTLSVFFQTFFLHRYGAHPHGYTKCRSSGERVMYSAGPTSPRARRFLVPEGGTRFYTESTTPTPDTEKDLHSPPYSLERRSR